MSQHFVFQSNLFQTKLFCHKTGSHGLCKVFRRGVIVSHNMRKIWECYDLLSPVANVLSAKYSETHVAKQLVLFPPYYLTAFTYNYHLHRHKRSSSFAVDFNVTFISVMENPVIIITRAMSPLRHVEKALNIEVKRIILLIIHIHHWRSESGYYLSSFLLQRQQCGRKELSPQDAGKWAQIGPGGVWGNAQIRNHPLTLNCIDCTRLLKPRVSQYDQLSSYLCMK